MFEREAWLERLPDKIKALSKWEFIYIQLINQQDDDYRHISSNLEKQVSMELIALDPFNSDLLMRKKREETNSRWLDPREKINNFIKYCFY